MMSRKQKAMNEVNQWIQSRFQRRECVKILPISKDSEKCGCGRYFGHHYYFQEEQESSSLKGEGCRWNVKDCTTTFSTDAYGTLRFQGVPKPYKSTYIRMDESTDPGDIWRLLVHVWGLEPPKLVITVCGGGNDFDLNPTFWHEFKNGLRKVVNTTSTWIITSGIRVGVVKHITAAIREFTPHPKKKNFVVIGIAPWGLIKRSDRLIGANKCQNYYPFLLRRSRFVSLCEGHDCFLLVDNGTFGRSGAETIVRGAFEQFLTGKTMENSGDRLMPVVSLMIGGGQLALLNVSHFVHSNPPIPVVICKNSGRAADLLAFAAEQGNTCAEEVVKEQLTERIQDILQVSAAEAETWVLLIRSCAAHSKLLTIFCGTTSGNVEEQLDCKILNALLQGRSSSCLDRLILLIMWNREDMVREMLEHNYDWEENALDSAMMQALMHNQVEFVQLLLNNGIAMDAFLTPDRLEELYNTDKGPDNTLSILMQDMRIEAEKYKKYSLPTIGFLIERLMGSGYRVAYRRRDFRIRYMQFKKGLINDTRFCQYDELGYDVSPTMRSNDDPTDEQLGAYFFKHPFSDLFMWAVLTNRFHMAKLMWRHGDESMAKALVGFKLYKSMAKEAKEDALEIEMCARLKNNSREFGRMANELLDQCYKTDEFLTMQLLTYELRNWGKKNCISLAALANNKQFIAHPSCQLLLADLWQGGMRIRKNGNFKVVCGVLLPLVIFTLPFKSKEELMLQAQTAAEHQEHCQIDKIPYDSDETSSSESESDWPLRKNDQDSPIDSSTETKRRERKTSKHTQSIQTDNKAKAEPKRSRTFSANGYFLPGSMVGTAKAKQSTNNTDATLLSAMPSTSQLFSLKMGTINQRNLSVAKKIREFYCAPITAFWSWTLSYLLFLMCFTYVVLVKATPQPTAIEYYILSFVVTFFADLIRKCLTNDARGLRDKVKVFSKHPWDRTSVWACLFFFVAFILRINASTMQLGRVILKVDVIYWYMRLLHILTVSSKLGPYITIYGKMVSKMVLLCTILFVLLIAFGVFRQSITFPNEDWNWMLVRNIVYKPYFMLYGEVYANEIDTCGDENQNCVYFHWLSPIFMTIYLLLSIIVFLNMMIAAFNFVFVNISAHSNLIWKFQKYEQVMDYERLSFLPPPFVVIVHICLIIGHCCQKLPWRKRFRQSDPSLKLFLNESDVARLHDFENQCLEDVIEKRKLENSSTVNCSTNELAIQFDDLRSQVKQMQHELNVTLRDMGLKMQKDEKTMEKSKHSSSCDSRGRPPYRRCSDYNLVLAFSSTVDSATEQPSEENLTVDQSKPCVREDEQHYHPEQKNVSSNSHEKSAQPTCDKEINDTAV